MRFIIYGAGAIGGTIGARLFQHGREVVLIARGAHFEAIKERGLVFKTPRESVVLAIPCLSHPSEIAFHPDDVVFMCTKTQDSLEALNALRAAAGEETPVVCAQNGVTNERMALRRFENVYGMVVMLPASHLEPGVVQAESTTMTGILDAGRFPSGTDSRIGEITAALAASRFSSLADGRVMRWKYTKLLRNLGNALQALCEPSGAEGQDVLRLATREALACYQAAGIDSASREEEAARRADHVQTAPVEGRTRGGGSSWQSIARGAGSIEVDYLNGEIVFLGRLNNVPTPANRVLQQMANRLVLEGGRPGSYTLDQVRERIVQAGGRF
jgi:2-dehydropantoate 2-reductase